MTSVQMDAFEHIQQLTEAMYDLLDTVRADIEDADMHHLVWEILDFPTPEQFAQYPTLLEFKRRWAELLKMLVVHECLVTFDDEDDILISAMYRINALTASVQDDFIKYLDFLIVVFAEYDEYSPRYAHMHQFLSGDLTLAGDDLLLSLAVDMARQRTYLQMVHTTLEASTAFEQ